MLRKQTYLTIDLCRAVLAHPIRREVQSDGRVRCWGRVTLPGEADARIVRVVTL